MEKETNQKDYKRLAILGGGVILAILMFSGAIPAFTVLHIGMTGASIILGIVFLRSGGEFRAWNPRLAIIFRRRLSQIVSVLFFLTAAAWPVGALLQDSMSLADELLLAIQVLGIVVAGSMCFIPVDIKMEKKK